MSANSVSPVEIPESFRRYLKQHMVEDHEKLESMLDDAASLVAHRFFYPAAKRFEEFRIREEQHMAVEEEIVFPLLESLSPGSVAVAEVKAEHEVIRQAMGAAGGAISATDREQFETVHGKLAAALMAHTKQEDELLARVLESCVGTTKELLLKIARL
jgi:hemerythrin-like domain-containing protein